jgi:hypothetical protein
LKETAKAGRSILDYDTHSPSADAYRRLGREVLVACGDVAAVVAAPAKPATRAAHKENLLSLPVLAVAAPEPVVAVARRVRADAPQFEAFIVEGWQRWLGASS